MNLKIYKILLENLIIVNFNRDIHKKFSSISDKHAEMFSPYTAECQYDFEFECKNQPSVVATVYQPIQHKNYEKKLKKN